MVGGLRSDRLRGAAALRYLSIKLDAVPARWGYFRLAPPLGLFFSAGLAALAAYGLIDQANVSDIGWRLVWELPAKPSISQVSELFFQLKQAFDDFIVMLLTSVMDKEWARIVGIVVSVNVLSGFVASLYAAIIASVVRAAETASPVTAGHADLRELATQMIVQCAGHQRHELLASAVPGVVENMQPARRPSLVKLPSGY